MLVYPIVDLFGVMITGLLRCGKSCRLRWTNYLRPGIKRGQFSSEEVDTIIQLQTVLGNRYVVICSILGKLFVLFFGLLQSSRSFCIVYQVVCYSLPFARKNRQ